MGKLFHILVDFYIRYHLNQIHLLYLLFQTEHYTFPAQAHEKDFFAEITLTCLTVSYHIKNSRKVFERVSNILNSSYTG